MVGAPLSSAGGGQREAGNTTAGGLDKVILGRTWVLLNRARAFVSNVSWRKVEEDREVAYEFAFHVVVYSRYHL